MNDQRQVIFSQRLKVLKDDNAVELINDFLEEQINELLIIKNKYEKTNNRNEYLTSLKSVIGNPVSDESLLEMTAISDKNFRSEIKEIFDKKRNDRIKLIGEAQNNDIEKKIFIQIIDFSWRSHLQYLEQLRQVVGFRSYGQKDPLSEFKKEAFTLFEGLLLKIKAEIIKFLLNINLVIKNEENSKTNFSNEAKKSKVGRNENVPAVQEKNLNIVTEALDHLIFLKASRASFLAFSWFTIGEG